ncbi:uncharacterized protein EV422DRAFT_357189 [Fimicolochytrium jonesii]|uniref:uncharacterized protein n=1 Tax=Fimicolochytrium jonesii TaxID=1396493 RepID=UPI0022FEE736|nr:uncharacterized protein EV422DRAFT_357189 [Fimicolochytrium jonesii]KAI8823480.1 hypothetical protein EV422DRAFT_357189 [Fimicolochytrium jonesii]
MSSVHASSLEAVAKASEVPSGVYHDDYVFPKTKLALDQPETSPGKTPLVAIACGSFSPVTNLHLRIFEMAKDHFADHDHYYLCGGYMSPVSDAYNKAGLVGWEDRVQMCEAALNDSDWIMVDPWESRQKEWQRTAWVLDHFDVMINGKDKRGHLLPDGTRRKVHIMLLAGSDVIQSFTVPKLWREEDLHHIVGHFGCIIIERQGADVGEFLLKDDILYQHRVGCTMPLRERSLHISQSSASLQKMIHLIKQYISNDISSTKIRLLVKRKRSIKYLLPDAVIDHIFKNGLWGAEPKKRRATDTEVDMIPSVMDGVKKRRRG